MNEIMTHAEAEALRTIMQNAMTEARLTISDKAYNEQYPMQPAQSWVGIWYNDIVIAVINNRQGWDAFLALVTSMNMQEVNNA